MAAWIDLRGIRKHLSDVEGEGEQSRQKGESRCRRWKPTRHLGAPPAPVLEGK